MEFHYRYVGYGTAFMHANRVRGAQPKEEAATLCENELVVDVGSVCHGHEGEERAILDHHFHRPHGQFPSASAAVLHKAAWIWERFGNGKVHEHGVWLVTHREPDFDAYCAMFLARGVITGAIPHHGWPELGIAPDSWRHGAGRSIDWFKPDLRGLEPGSSRACAILLAAFAARIDNCRPLQVSRGRTLNAVLYAGLLRGRDFQRFGAVPLFEEVWRQMAEKRLNPLVDSVLEDSVEFGPELALLNGQVDAYRRDLKRARQVVVSVQRTAEPFGEWFGPVRDQPLLDRQLAITAEQQLPLHSRVQADGIFLRDPECLLFKEWARADTECAPASRGFLFTAIAYSDASSDGIINHTRYVFALDPERASGAHLYGVWARLQAEEARALRVGGASGGAPRSGFETRAIGECDRHFDDPWFDGVNYACTIVDTPNRGTAIAAPGSNSRLDDDVVSSIVQDELELSCYSGQAHIKDLPITAQAAGPEPAWRPAPLTSPVPLPASHFRVGRVGLAAGMNLDHGGISEQIGRRLWLLLEGDMRSGVPTDFVARHLVRHDNWVAVWNRRGAMIAFKPAGHPAAAAIVQLFTEIASLLVTLATLVARQDATEADSLKTVSDAEVMMRRVAELKHRLVLSENRLAARFFEATRVEELLETIRGISASAAARLEAFRGQELAGRMAQNVEVVAHVQTMVEWIEVFVISVYASHLWHMFAAENEPLHHIVEQFAPAFAEWFVPAGVLAAAAVGMSVALLILRPWRQRVVN